MLNYFSKAEEHCEANVLPVVHGIFQTYLKMVSSHSSHKLSSDEILSPHFMGFCFLFVFLVCLFILCSAQPPFAETDCYTLPKNSSKQMTRGERNLFLL